MKVFYVDVICESCCMPVQGNMCVINARVIRGCHDFNLIFFFMMKVFASSLGEGDLEQCIKSHGVFVVEEDKNDDIDGKPLCLNSMKDLSAREKEELLKYFLDRPDLPDKLYKSLRKKNDTAADVRLSTLMQESLKQTLLWLEYFKVNNDSTVTIGFINERMLAFQSQGEQMNFYLSNDGKSSLGSLKSFYRIKQSTNDFSRALLLALVARKSVILSQLFLTQNLTNTSEHVLSDIKESLYC